MTQPTLYTLPGLGFDHRIFSRLDLQGYDIYHLDWMDPLTNESIINYAKRFSEKIIHDHQNCILIGHSFGGIIAQEIAAHIPIKKTILISSIKSEKEKPINFKMAAPLGFHYLFTKKLTLKTFDYWGKHFGYETPDLQALFKKMVSERSDKYLQWALFQLSKWKGVKSKKINLVHIHGELDKTFPIKLINDPVVRVARGTHMMVYNKPEVLKKLLEEHLKQ